MVVIPIPIPINIPIIAKITIQLLLEKQHFWGFDLTSTELSSSIFMNFQQKSSIDRPSSSMMGYSPIAKKSPIDQMGKNIWGKLMVFFAIRSIYLNGTNYHKLLLHYGQIYQEN